MDTKCCTLCHRELPLSEFARDMGARRADCKTCARRRHTARRLGIRQAVLAALGDACQRCGNADPRVLEVDHVNGGGKREHAAGIRTDRPEYLERVKANPGEFQLLCANCHKIKTYEDRVAARGEEYPQPATAEDRAALRAANYSPDRQRARSAAAAAARAAKRTP